MAITLLDTDEVAALLSLDKKEFLELLDGPAGPPVIRVDGGVYFYPFQVRRWIQSRSVRVTGDPISTEELEAAQAAAAAEACS